MINQISVNSLNCKTSLRVCRHYFHGFSIRVSSACMKILLYYLILIQRNRSFWISLFLLVCILFVVLEFERTRQVLLSHIPSPQLVLMPQNRNRNCCYFWFLNSSFLLLQLRHTSQSQIFVCFNCYLQKMTFTQFLQFMH